MSHPPIVRFRQRLLTVRTTARLGDRSSAYVAWYRFGLNAGLRRRFFPPAEFATGGDHFRAPSVHKRPWKPATSSVAPGHPAMADKLLAGNLLHYATLKQQICNPPAWFLNPFNDRRYAGALPTGHWTLDPTAGGGRIVGEGCHFVDLLRHLAGSPIVRGNTTFQRVAGNVQTVVANIQLQFADGSIGTVHYLANGSKDFPKECLEMFCSGGVLQLDNFRDLRGFGWPGFTREKLCRQDKGHTAELAAVVTVVCDGTQSPIPWDELVEVSTRSIRLEGEQ